MRTKCSPIPLKAFALATLALALLCEVGRAQEFNIFGLTNQVWRFDSTNDWYTPTGNGWTDPLFDDSTWPAGRAILTSDGNSTIVALRGTTIRDLRNPVPGIPGSVANQAVYFRTRFTWPEAAVTPTAFLRLTVRVDDGVAVYLNGNRVGGLRMGPAPGHNSFTENAALVPCVDASGNNDGTCDEIILIDATYLVPGENVLSATVHQNNSTSSDMTWGARLDGIIPFVPTITDDSQVTNRVVIQSRSTSMSVTANGFPAPTYQWYKDGVPIDPVFNPTATNATFVITRMAATDAGSYHVVVSNSQGDDTSRTAVISYEADATAPRAIRAVGSPGYTTMTIEFDEGMDPATATDAANYTVSPPLTITTAELAPNGSSVVLTTLDQQAPDTLYTVTAPTVYDLAGNIIGANNSAQFRSWVPSGNCSGVLFEAFSSTATTIPAFTNSPTYPNSPFTNLFIQGMHSRMAFPANNNENYGGRMRGLFIPLVSGNWRFYMSSDDPGELWFNPNGGTSAGRQLVAREGGCCQLYQPAGAIQTSPAFPLVAGQGYYLELIYKENAGGDYGMVAARLENDGVPTGGNDQGAETGEAIGGTVAPSRFATMGFGAVPAGIAGAFSIGQQPSSAPTEANRQITLTVGANAPNAPYVCYQWQKSDDGGTTFDDIPGATRASYTTPYLTQADDHGDVYRVVVGVPGVSATSANATLNVTADVTRPRVVRVVGISPTQVAVLFSEPMTGSSAEDPFPYEIDQGIQVGQAILSPNNPHRIDLMLANSMTLGNTYQLTVSTPLGPLIDASNNPLDPDPTRVNFRAINFAGNPDTLITLPTNTKRPIGSLTERGMKARMIQVFPTIRPPMLPITEDILAGRFIDPSTQQPYPNLAPQPTFVETDTINYGDNPAGAGTGRLLPDRAFPGYTAAADNMVMEVLAYLELREGVYTMGVNSDDDFQVTPATSVTDPNNAIVLGFFSGGRGPADSTFSFYVPEDGLYPFRLIWNEYQGGATAEWWIQNLVDGSYIGINGSDEIKAFVPVSAPRLTVARNAGAVTLSWAEGGTLQEAPDITGPWTDSATQTNPQTFTPVGKRFFRIRP